MQGEDIGLARPTRERIAAVARDLYVRRGHDGFSFGDIAEAIGTTRANIHYHFGSKRQLMAELIDYFVDDALERIGRHWAAPGGFCARLRAQRDDLRAFYLHYNPAPGARHVWSPVSRFRLDLPVLGPLAAAALDRVNRGYDACLRRAVQEAVAAGELRADTEVDDVVRLLRTTIMSCGPITQDTGSFTEVERLFTTMETTLLRAFGPHAALDHERPPSVA